MTTPITVGSIEYRILKACYRAYELAWGREWTEDEHAKFARMGTQIMDAERAHEQPEPTPRIADLVDDYDLMMAAGDLGGAELT